MTGRSTKSKSCWKIPKARLKLPLPAANKLIFKEGVKFLIGPVVPPTSMAVARISESAKVLRVLSVGVGTPVEINKDTPLTFCPFSTACILI